MSKRKRKPVHKKPRLVFHADQALVDAVEAYRQGQDVPPTTTGVMIKALKEFLRQHGHWPPPGMKPAERRTAKASL
jgi:hypothetical protein